MLRAAESCTEVLRTRSFWHHLQEGKEQQDFLQEGMATAERLQKQIEKWELQSLLGGEYDEGGAVLSIQVAFLVTGSSNCNRQ